jgi:hypothetical protein
MSGIYEWRAGIGSRHFTDAPMKLALTHVLVALLTALACAPAESPSPSPASGSSGSSAGPDAAPQDSAVGRAGEVGGGAQIRADAPVGSPDRPTPAPDSGSADLPGTANGDGAPAARVVLLVVGTENGMNMRGAGIGDRFIKTHLETALGHTVMLANDNASAADLRAAAAQADLVIVSESVSSAVLQNKLKSLPEPILNYEAFIQDEMGLTPPGPPGDPGEPANFALGVKANEARIDIVNDLHPLAAGLSGTVTVYSAPKSVTWGKVAESAEVVATLPGDRAGVAIYVYRKDARLQDGSAAAGVRVGFFLEDDDVTGTANLLTANGLRLFDAAVRFTLEAGAR